MALEKFEVYKRWTGEVAFIAEIETTPGMTRGWKLRLAVAWALASSVPCDRLDLNGVDFTGYECPAGSSFVGSSFVRSSFDGSSFDDSSFDDSRFDGSRFVRSRFDRSRFDRSRFVGSSFDGSSFDGSSFVGSSFVGSRFDGSSFDDSRFDDSRFDGSRFDRSSFDGSSFVGSSFVRSRFDGSRFDGSRFDDEVAAKADFLEIISDARAEIPGLIATLREGRVNGSAYTGECTCLIGTIANVRGVDVYSLKTDSSRPAERWFMMISTGDKPGDQSPGGYASSKALEWALEFIGDQSAPRPASSTAPSVAAHPAARADEDSAAAKGER